MRWRPLAGRRRADAARRCVKRSELMQQSGNARVEVEYSDIGESEDIEIQVLTLLWITNPITRTQAFQDTLCSYYLSKPRSLPARAT
jgi:hypothetical protein